MEVKPKKIKKVFKPGPISATYIAESIANHQSKTGIGAHSIFLGQVRADERDGKTVKAIEYTAYEEMAEKEIHEIRERAFEQYNLSCMHIYHSIGTVPVGEVCLFIFVSSPHRNDCTDASRQILEEIKKKAPIFGKELFEDESHQWKVNRS